MLGSFGSIVFECADNHVLTFQELSFNRSANYAEHKIIGRNGLVEFTGLNAGSGTIKMTFDSALGIDPQAQAQELQRMLQDHEACNFVLDGQPVGTGYWVIESISETVELVDWGGKAKRITATVNLKEYHEI